MNEFEKEQLDEYERIQTLDDRNENGLQDDRYMVYCNEFDGRAVKFVSLPKFNFHPSMVKNSVNDTSVLLLLFDSYNYPYIYQQIIQMIGKSHDSTHEITIDILNNDNSIVTRFTFPDCKFHAIDLGNITQKRQLTNPERELTIEFTYDTIDVDGSSLFCL